MAEQGVTTQGAELLLSLPVPRETRGPLATVGCSIALGSSPKAGTAVLTLAAGAGASIGRPARALALCAADLDRYADRWSAGHGASAEPPVRPENNK